MILKIILFELDGLQTNIERSFSEIWDTLVDDFSILKKDVVGTLDKLCDDLGFAN
jgi:hypothetical protein